jgi:hypothetical protein
MKKDITALIPVKKTSDRVKEKNTRKFSNTSLYELKLKQISSLLCFDHLGGSDRYAHIPVKPYENGDPIEKAVTFIEQKEQLVEYFTSLNQKGLSFNVSSKEFDPYRFKNDETVEFSDWFSSKMKSSASA